MGPMVGNFIFWNGWKMECVFGQAVWKDILKLTLAKTYETEVNLHLFRQAIWEHIRKFPDRTDSKSS